MNWTINQTVDLSRGYTPVVWPDALMVSGDVGAHTWRLTVLDNGVPAYLRGATITGSFLRADGSTVLVSGTVSGNIASVTLTDACYAVEGKLVGTMRAVISGATVTLAAVVYTVKLLTSGDVVDPGVTYQDFQIDASPAGTYADLDALIADDPDYSKIYITLDDANWCYHNGTTWVAGGLYQATQLQDGSVSISKTDFVKPLNPQPRIWREIMLQDYYLPEMDGYTAAQSTGQPVTTEYTQDFTLTDYIPTEPHITYSADFRQITLYDADKQYLGPAIGFIDHDKGGRGEVTTPANSYFMRVAHRIVDRETRKLIQITPFAHERQVALEHSGHTMELCTYLTEALQTQFSDANAFETIPLLQYHDPTYDGKALRATDGGATETEYTADFTVTKWFPVDPTATYLMEYRSIACHDINGDYIPETGWIQDPNNGINIVRFPPSTRSIRLCIKTNRIQDAVIHRISPRGDEILSKPELMTLSSLPLKGKRVVALGTSITGRLSPSMNYLYWAERLTGAEIINGGLSGSRMSYVGTTSANSGCKIVDQIISGDFSDSIAFTSAQYSEPTKSDILLRINDLSNVDFSNVNMVTLEYGTNDFLNGVPVNGSGIDSFEGAYRYLIETLLTAYPHIVLLLITPTYLYQLGTNIFDPDTYTGYGSGSMLDFVEVVRNLSTEYKLPLCDNYSNLGINQFTRNVYFNNGDGVHPNQKAHELMGRHVAATMMGVY